MQDSSQASYFALEQMAKKGPDTAVVADTASDIVEESDRMVHYTDLPVSVVPWPLAV